MKTSRTIWIFAAVLTLAAPYAARGEDGARVSVAPGFESIELTGLPESQRAAVARAHKNWDPAEWQKLLAVYVGEKPDRASPALLGSYRFDEGRVIFQPRFPFRAGLTYTVAYDLSALDDSGAHGDPVRVHVRIPAEPSPPARVERVYPTRAVLPENQLKFYFYFSAPMSRGDSYRHVRLIQENGEEVDLPFLTLEQELWDKSGRRFTLLFDPGRVKRGLKPREEEGPSLIEGGNYALVISRQWRDAAGMPLARDYIKPFRVDPPDDVQPDPKRWQVAAPPAGSRSPLEVQFDEPLDYAMLHRVIDVRDAEGRAVEGEVRVDRQETRWRFRPESPWRAGKYQLVIDATLEDLAANSIGRPFEVDIFEKVDKSIAIKQVSLPFKVVESRQ